MSRIGHTNNRHPLCPECGYNLVATVANEGRTCPECGCAFEPHELTREVRPGDWTPMRGLGNLARRQAIKALALGLIITGVFGVLQLLLEGPINRSVGVFSIFLLVGLLFVTAIVGAISGSVLARDANEHAGMDGAPVAIVGIAMTAAMMSAVVLTLTMTLGLTIAPPTGIVVVATGVAAITLVRRAVFEE